ncbi:helix-turn-helix domain-containing protein [Enterococcus mundtii]|uniref:helix-turn-helix domain-containing protein n=1 Tax=Enterococcus mundtii TaxID=53346 RepID=UPI000E065D25|nr:helix-turn-helix transcriptional regulator [Enterococcus mundtii]STD24969.1 Uncharacterised protein [Enterococcus mundtii]
MNWFDQYKQDFDFKSNYQLSKKTGITPSSFTRLNNSDDWRNVKFGTMILLAKAAELSLDEFVEYLETQKDPSSN